jgi:hypothetical protein
MNFDVRRRVRRYKYGGGDLSPIIILLLHRMIKKRQMHNPASHNILAEERGKSPNGATRTAKEGEYLYR